MKAGVNCFYAAAKWLEQSGRHGIMLDGRGRHVPAKFHERKSGAVGGAVFVRSSSLKGNLFSPDEGAFSTLSR
jgi:hypothetical protein